MVETSLKPDGYSGLVKQLTEAKELLTFVPDDRGPQIVHACCTKWYQQNLRKMITDARTYEKCNETWDSFLQLMKEKRRSGKFPFFAKPLHLAILMSERW